MNCEANLWPPFGGDRGNGDKMMKQENLPTGWTEQRVKRVLTHYESQSEDDAIAEDEAAFADQTQAVMEIPLELVPTVRELIAQYYRDSRVPA